MQRVGSPWQNGHIESFDGKLRDELLAREVFDSMWEIKVMLEDHAQHLQPLPATQLTWVSHTL